MIEGIAALIDFNDVASSSDPVVSSVLENIITSRLDKVPYRQFRLTPKVLVIVFNTKASALVTESLRKLAHELKRSHHGNLSWKIFDLKSDLGRFRTDCRHLTESSREEAHEEHSYRPENDRLSALLNVIDAVRTVDLTTHLVRQAVVKLEPQQPATIEFEEFWVNMDSLEQAMGIQVRNDPWKFLHMTEFLDFKVLRHLLKEWPASHNVSLNFHCSNILLPQFDKLCDAMEAAQRQSLIFELSISEMANQRDTYIQAAHKLRDLGFMIAIDNAILPTMAMASEVLPLVRFVKVPWTDALTNASADQKNEIAQLISSHPSVDFVLNRCGDEKNVEVGEILGFRLFQGYGVEVPEVRLQPAPKYVI